MRDDGIVLLLFIKYSNTYTYNTNNLRYEYTVKQVEDTKFKVVQPVYTKQVDTRGKGIDVTLSLPQVHSKNSHAILCSSLEPAWRPHYRFANRCGESPLEICY
jgi:hypothetical protein